jgi:hypothetical protein
MRAVQLTVGHLLGLLRHVHTAYGAAVGGALCGHLQRHLASCGTARRRMGLIAASSNNVMPIT